jgi:hypothetical protein
MSANSKKTMESRKEIRGQNWAFDLVVGLSVTLVALLPYHLALQSVSDLDGLRNFFKASWFFFLLGLLAVIIIILRAIKSKNTIGRIILIVLSVVNVINLALISFYLFVVYGG